MRAEFFVAIKDLSRHKKVLVVIAFALLLGIMNTTVTVGLLRGFEKYLSKDLIEVFAGQIMIMPPEGQAYFEDLSLIEDRVLALPQVKDTFPQLEVEASLLSGAKGKAKLEMLRTEVHVLVVDSAKEKGVTVISRKIKSGDYLSGESGEIILGSNYAYDVLKVDVGDYLELDFQGRTAKFRVVGIVETGVQLIDSMYAAIDVVDAKKLFGRENVFNRLFVTLYDRDQADVVKAELLSAGVADSVQTWKEILAFGKEALNTLAIILLVVSGVAILAASVSIAVLLYTNVLHRTKEIGTMRALGASKGFVLRMYFVEGLIVGAFGVGLGVLVSSALITYLTANPMVFQGITLRVALDLSAMATACIATLLCVFAASAYPAYKASKLEPIEALKYE